MFFIELIQKLSSPFFDMFFEAITFFAEQYIALLILGIVFWCMRKEFSVPFCLTAVSSYSINTMFKNIFRIERPYVSLETSTAYAPHGVKESGKLFVLRGHTATGYSFPSGHTQFAVSAYGALGFYFKKIWRILAIIAILLVGISRMYLGVHTIYDVLGAVIIGSLWTWLGFIIYKKIVLKYGNIMIFIYAAPALISAVLMNRNDIGDTFRTFGLVFGMAVGLYIEERFIKFNPSNIMDTSQNKHRLYYKLKYNIIKVIAGIFCAVVIYFGLSFLLKFLPDNEIIKNIFELFLTFALSFWTFCGYPFIIVLIQKRKD